MARPKYSWRSASKTNYQAFKIKYPKSPLTFKEFSKIIYTYNQGLMDYVMETGDQIWLPHGFGMLSINRKKTEKYFIDKQGREHIILPIDWKATQQEGERIFLMNHHTKGYRFKWFWFKSSALFRMHDLYAFKPARVHSRKMALLLNTNPAKYLDLYRTWFVRKSKTA